ncbi:MAG: hypothetical protein LBG93_07340 [Treponema sp.]|nr:hypothetical protein [Treponema sp.]
MMKKALVALIIAVFFSGAVFAQADFGAMPKNTITVDIGPTILGAAFGIAGDIIGEEGLSSSGFGIGAQYERQLSERLSVAGRFAFMRLGMGLTFNDDYVTAQTNLGLSSYAIEGRVRFYPTGRTFFLGGMLGYANLATVVSGSLLVDADGLGNLMAETVNFSVNRGYFKFGARLGWRIDFGQPGGFVFEPSFGWYGAAGFGSSMANRVSQRASDVLGGEIDGMDDLNDVFSILENFVFIGGPRLSLSFGWRF